MRVRYIPRDYLEPLLVSRPGAIARAGGLTAAIKRGIYHGLIPPAYRGPGKPTRFRLTQVDAFIEEFICTGRIDEPQYWLPSEAKAFEKRAPSKLTTDHGSETKKAGEY